MDFKKIAPLFLVVLVVSGCDTGEAPKGLTPDQTRAAVDNLPPQQRIDYINRSPMPAAEKAQKIADIKAKAGIK